MSKDIEEPIAHCPVCAKFRRRSQREPLQPHEVPQWPWETLASDIFTVGSVDYLVIVDYLSKYPEICLLKDKTTGTVITSMKSTFAHHGIPSKLVVDNMPFNSFKWKQFAQDWGFEIVTSRPGYPQSNGVAKKT
jgi:hypothetical protein